MNLVEPPKLSGLWAPLQQLWRTFSKKISNQQQKPAYNINRYHSLFLAKAPNRLQQPHSAPIVTQFLWHNDNHEHGSSWSQPAHNINHYHNLSLAKTPNRLQQPHSASICIYSPNSNCYCHEGHPSFNSYVQHQSAELSPLHTALLYTWHLVVLNLVISFTQALKAIHVHNQCRRKHRFWRHSVDS